MVATLRHCPRCECDLPISEFGICRSRPDGLNRYDKRCIRTKIAAQRQRFREYKAAHPTVAPKVPMIHPYFSPLRKLSPSDRVREAIRLGAQTQKEIANTTRLPKDEVCDALANLLLWTRDIRTDVVNHTRMYFVNDADGGQSVKRQPIKTREPRSYGVSTIYFAA